MIDIIQSIVMIVFYLIVLANLRTMKFMNDTIGNILGILKEVIDIAERQEGEDHRD